MKKKHSNNWHNLRGKRFGRLVAKKCVGIEPVSRGALWLCKCDCGKEVIVTRKSLMNGHTQSCGCLRNELRKKESKQITVHFETKTILEWAKIFHYSKAGVRNHLRKDKDGGKGWMELQWRRIHYGEEPFGNRKDATHRREVNK